jgi:hypothetical protein
VPSSTIACSPSRAIASAKVVSEPFGIDQLSNHAMDEDLVGNRKAGRRAGADGLDRRNASLRKPFAYNASVGAGFMRAN